MLAFVENGKLNKQLHFRLNLNNKTRVIQSDRTHDVQRHITQDTQHKKTHRKRSDRKTVNLVKLNKKQSQKIEISRKIVNNNQNHINKEVFYKGFPLTQRTPNVLDVNRNGSSISRKNSHHSNNSNHSNNKHQKHHHQIKLPKSYERKNLFVKYRTKISQFKQTIEDIIRFIPEHFQEENGVKKVITPVTKKLKDIYER